ncbi:hypothetical protein J0H58_26265 [bacterium]|nr:hypothetical protein [bacterium]
MKRVTLTETPEPDFFEGDDGAYYTPLHGVEGRCRWCFMWGLQHGLYHRQVLYTTRTALVCGRHVTRSDDWRGVA